MPAPATSTSRSKVAVFIVLPLFAAVMLTIIGTAIFQWQKHRAADRIARAETILDAFPPALIAYQASKAEVDPETGAGAYPIRIINLLETEPPLLDIESFPGGGWRYDNDAGYLFSREFIVIYRRETFDGVSSYSVEVRQRFHPERVIERIAPDGSIEKDFVEPVPVLGRTEAL